jgi:hypothetical protein
MKGWMGIVPVVVLAAALGAARPAQAGYLEDAGWGSLTVLANAGYMPVKLVYSALGGLTGGLAFALTGGDMNTAETVWVAAMGGTYVLTPRMLQGEDPVAFCGTPAGSDAATVDTGEHHDLQEQQLSGR